MNKPRFIVFSMTIFQAVLLGMMTDTRVFPFVCVLAAIAAFMRPIALNISFRRQVALYGFLLVLFMLKSRIMPLDLANRYSPFPNDYSMNHAFAQALLVIQIILLATRTFEEREMSGIWSTVHLVPMLGALQLVAVTDFVSSNPLYRQGAIVGAGLFAVLFCLWTLSAVPTLTVRERRGWAYPAILTLLIAGALYLGIVGAQLSIAHATRVELFLFNYLRPNVSTGVGASPQRIAFGSITAQQDKNRMRPALRIYSAQTPGYLRGQAYARFDGRFWHAPTDYHPAHPAPNLPTVLDRMTGGEEAYVVRNGYAPPDADPIEIWHASAGATMLYTRLDTLYVGTAAPEIQINRHQAIHAKAVSRALPYYLATGVARVETPDASLLEECLLVPDSLTREARETAQSVLTGAETTQDKIDAVLNFFHRHFSYRIGIQIPPGEDAVSYFLTQRPPAHCEYFAAGAVMLLRLGGVPCRYVTGFAVTEINTAGGYWIARNRDAHAWAEVWDDTRGWVIVEATPGDGMPDGTTVTPFTAWADVLRFHLTRLWALVRDEGVGAVMRLFKNTIGSWPGRLLLFALALAVIVSQRRRFFRNKPRTEISAEEARIQRLLEQMDRHVFKQGFSRPAHETLHKFADRIAAADKADPWHTHAAAWYQHCAALRCNGTTPEAAVKILCAQAPIVWGIVPKNS